MDNRPLRGPAGTRGTDRIVVLRAGRGRRLLDRLAALPPRTTVALNALAFVSLAAALLVLVLI